MQVVKVKIEDIKPYEKNAKKHPDNHVKKLAASIEEFGFNQPIVVDKDNVIIAGHGRFLAAQELGLEMVPVVVLDLDPERAKAYRLADNKLNESDWDKNLVFEELKELSMPMLKLTGFSQELILQRDKESDDEEEEQSGCPRCREIRQALEGHAKRSGHNIVVRSDSKNIDLSSDDK